MGSWALIDASLRGGPRKGRAILPASVAGAGDHGPDHGSPAGLDRPMLRRREASPRREVLVQTWVRVVGLGLVSRLRAAGETSGGSSMRVIEKSPHRPRARLMDAACGRCRTVVLAAVLALSLSSCVAAAGECSGLFVPENEECEPGCGVPVGRRILDPSGCTVGYERMRWCVRGPGVLTEDYRCRIDETDGSIYLQTVHPAPADVPTNVRYCTEAEETPRVCE